jgi:hypothetical protein
VYTVRSQTTKNVIPEAETDSQLAALVAPDLVMWKADGAKLRDSLKVPPSFNPWTDRPAFRGHGLRSDGRIIDILNIAWIDRRSKARRSSDPDDLVKGFFVNVSQSVSRRAWGSIMALTQNSVIYTYEHDMVMSPEMNMRMQGFPSNLNLDDLTDNQVRSLAGEAFCLPCIGSALYGFFLCSKGLWWTES